MERFTITAVDGKEARRNHLDFIRKEIAINVGDLKNIRKNSHTVPNPAEARKFSLAQLTR